MMAPRSQWADDFKAWIGMPHENDAAEMQPLPPPPEEEDDEQEDKD
jgi:hypothetical protein